MMLTRLLLGLAIYLSTGTKPAFAHSYEIKGTIADKELSAFIDVCSGKTKKLPRNKVVQRYIVKSRDPRWDACLSLANHYWTIGDHETSATHYDTICNESPDKYTCAYAAIALSYTKNKMPKAISAWAKACPGSGTDDCPHCESTESAMRRKWDRRPHQFGGMSRGPLTDKLYACPKLRKHKNLFFPEKKIRTQSKLRPFAGFAIGAYYDSSRRAAGEFSINTGALPFALGTSVAAGKTFSSIELQTLFILPKDPFGASLGWGIHQDRTDDLVSHQTTIAAFSYFPIFPFVRYRYYAQGTEWSYGVYFKVGMTSRGIHW